jgi:hypothetical protein
MKRSPDDPIINSQGNQDAEKGKQQDEPDIPKQGQLSCKDRSGDRAENNYEGITDQHSVKDRAAKKQCPKTENEIPDTVHQSHHSISTTGLQAVPLGSAFLSR